MTDRTFSGRELCAMSGRSGASLDPKRLGKDIGITPVGSGNRRRYSQRQAVIFIIAAELHGRHGASRYDARADRVAAALRGSDEWSEFLVVTDVGHQWVADPESAVRVSQAHAPATTTVVPVARYEAVVADA